MTDDVKIDVVPADNSPTVWKSMCLTMDRNATVYFTQIIIICGIMTFAIYKLSTNESAESQTIYMGLLTMMIGLALPNPVFKK